MFEEQRSLRLGMSKAQYKVLAKKAEERDNYVLASHYYNKVINKTTDIAEAESYRNKIDQLMEKEHGNTNNNRAE